MRTRKSEPQLTPQQRRKELIDILGMPAARMPLALSNCEGATVTTPPDPPDEKLSETGQTRLDVSAERPLSVTTGCR